MRSYSSRVIVLPLERSARTKVLPALRETTFVCTFTLPNSVTRACGISSVKRRSSSGEGLSWMVRACTFTGVSLVVRDRSAPVRGPSEPDYPTQRARPKDPTGAYGSLRGPADRGDRPRALGRGAGRGRGHRRRRRRGPVRGRRGGADDRPARRGRALRARVDLGQGPRREGDPGQRLGHRGDGREPAVRGRLARGPGRRRSGG